MDLTGKDIMSVKIEASTLSMPESLDSLKITPSTVHLHRVFVELANTDQWYKIIREANTLYGSHNWRGQPRARRRLERERWSGKVTSIWFDVPDPAIASWLAVKLAVQVKLVPNK